MAKERTTKDTKGARRFTKENPGQRAVGKNESADGIPSNLFVSLRATLVSFVVML